MNTLFPVVITMNGERRTYSPAFQTEQSYRPGWQSVLRQAYGRATLQCACGPQGRRRLAVKYYAASDLYDLARYAFSGAEHARQCQYYAPDAAEGAGGSNSRGVLAAQADGTVKIRLGVGLATRTRSTGNAVSPTGAGGSGNGAGRQAAMTLLGLLHYLWSEAQLNQWHPAWAGRRTDAAIPARLMHVAESVRVGRALLADVLLVPARHAHWAEARENALRIERALAAKLRVVAVAPLASFTTEREATMARRLVLARFFGMPPVFLTAGLWAATQQKFPLAVGAWRRGQRVLAIAQLELRASLQSGVVARAIDVALMPVTPEWIPVDSRFEHLVAEQLVARERSFFKPLRFDAQHDCVLPDFVLTDLERDVPMEVFGRNDDAYVLRMTEKIAYFDRLYGPGGWWKWSPTGDVSAAEIPPFPSTNC